MGCFMVRKTEKWHDPMQNPTKGLASIALATSRLLVKVMAHIGEGSLASASWAFFLFLNL